MRVFECFVRCALLEHVERHQSRIIARAFWQFMDIRYLQLDIVHSVDIFYENIKANSFCVVVYVNSFLVAHFHLFNFDSEQHLNQMFACVRVMPHYLIKNKIVRQSQRLPLFSRYVFRHFFLHDHEFLYGKAFPLFTVFIGKICALSATQKKNCLKIRKFLFFCMQNLVL